MRPLPSLLTLTVTAALVPTATAADAIDFQRDIRPVLAGRCFKCHGPGVQAGGVRLDTRESALKRKTIVPGNPDGSKLIRRITATDDARRMPPADAGERLTDAQVARLRAWIGQGADYTPHWAYLKPELRPLPPVKDASWPRNGIDYFILARLEQEGLHPSPEADRATLVRRLYLDLLGVLPEPAEVEGFQNDPAPDAYERLVDRLLASPHYGERQARLWLDLARYADSNGYTVDGKRSIWPYRDWVIDAFNRNLPFDQFTIEQLAGDLLPHPTRDQLVATGFQRNTPFNEEGGTDPEQFRVERTLDRTNTIGAAWLGLTVGCAQCHDHKYDAISQKEYYRLYAFFNSAEEPQLPLPTPEQERRLADLKAQLAATPGAKKPTGPQRELSGDELAAALRREAGDGWTILEPAEVRAENGTRLKPLPDKSVLAGGPTPDSEVYRVRAEAPEGRITAVRLEALTHASLPQRGPGRAKNGNFVLSQFVLEANGQPVPFARAVADHSQKKYDVADALLGDPKKGWAINVDDGNSPNVNRRAVFVLEKPLTVTKGQALTFTLRSSEWPKRYPLGRFRLAVTSASQRFLDLPLEAQHILLTDPRLRTEEEVASLRTLLTPMHEATADAGRGRQLQREIKALEATIPTTLVLHETATPRPTHVHLRGDFLNKGEAVEPGTLACLPPLAARGRTADRLDLARWLVSPDNPLTPRVVVNRMWQQDFGKGLVETENDFGMQGAPPTHPELLDWLAVQFVRGGWDVKAMHRLIVTSAAYRQASVVRPELRAKDPDNRLLGRQARLRLEAEIIRDAALSASGLLCRKLGGPGVYPPQPAEVFSFTQSRHEWPESKGPDRYRRGVYTFIWRQSQHPLLTTFDGPDAVSACTRRNRSDTPLQALHLANDAAFVEIAEGLGRRVLREGPADDAGRVDFIFRLCLARTPTPAERARLLAYLAQQQDAGAETAWTMVARALINLDEFITRE